MISKSLSTSERFAALHEHAKRTAEFCQALYMLMIVHADDFGRMQGDPQTVKLLVLPGSPRKLPEFSDALQALHDVELIHWYETDGRKYVQIERFDENQSGLHKRTKSKFPVPPGRSGNFPGIPSELNRTELNRTEGKAVPESGPSDGPALWAALIERLELSDHNRREWFAPCVVVRFTDTVLEVEAPGTVCQHLSQHFAPRFVKECADLLGRRRVCFLVAKTEARG